MSKVDLPVPATTDDVSRLYSDNPYISSNLDRLLRSAKIDSYIGLLHKQTEFKPNTNGYHVLNIYFLYRSINQLNEACNKLWSTMELYRRMVDSKPLFPRFDVQFMSSMSIPTLHYSNMSALISITTVFGVCPHAEKGQKMRFSYILRTARGVLLKDRKQYIVELNGTSSNGWHQQVIQTYQGLLKSGIGVPKVDLKSCSNLLRERNRVQYDILSETTMKEMKGNQVYFEYLKEVSNNIQTAARILQEVSPVIPRGIKSRLNSLIKYVPTLADRFAEVKNSA